MEQTEREDTSDDGSIVAIVDDWLEDLMDQSIPGSVVLLIVIVALAPALIKLVSAWIAHRANR